MPPTPVAAPWYGSMNDGWLCDSILKTAASPSPMSTAPAFSPGPCSTCGPFGRQRLQVHARALVAAVLGPHHREDAELGQVRLAAQEARRCARIRPASGRGVRAPWSIMDHLRARLSVEAGTARLALSDVSASDDSRRAITDSKITRPSALPSSGSHARSGCGIMPTTLRASLQMPAIAFTDPFGFAVVVDASRRDRCSGRPPAGWLRAARSTSGGAK